MKLVILGAGASFDCIYDYYDDLDYNEWRPPLANEIFDTRIKFRNIITGYPGGRYYLSQINAINDIEDFFQKQWHFLKNNHALELSSAFLNLNYCLAHLMNEITENNKYVGLSNYDVLVQKAYEYSIKHKEDVLFVTFNYDTLLEHSFSKVYTNINSRLEIEDYIKYPIKIIKPHGSANWVKLFNQGNLNTNGKNITDYLFFNKISLREINSKLGKEIKTVTNPLINEVNYGAQKWYTFPQLLIPLKDKDDFILPESHSNYLNNNLNKVDSILIIGWKGTEAKFQKLLCQSLSNKNIEVTSINGGMTGIENVFSPILPKAKFNHYNEFGQLEKADNRKVKHDSENVNRVIYHSSGKFSAYTINTLTEKSIDFFA